LRSADNIFSKSSIWVECDNFYGEVKYRSKNKITDYLIIGFDTEFKSPELDWIVDKDNPKEAKTEAQTKNTILSYQVHCKIFDPEQSDQSEWCGICYPEKGQRYTLSDIIIFSIWKGVSEGKIKCVPRTIYIVGHFTRADIPAFSDFTDLTMLMSSVRNTFLSIDGHIPVEIEFPDNQKVELKVLIRDTILLTPAASKSLMALGELVDVKKIKLDQDDKIELHYKRNMDQLLDDNPLLFEKYALNDALICVRYVEKLREQTKTLLGTTKIPATLTSIGVDLLWNSWSAENKNKPLQVLGKETVYENTFNKKLGYFINTTKTVDLREVSWHLSLATDCYHGGRNEQFWFGPAFEDDWIDYDLAGAYPTAMALIAEPDWKNIRITQNVDDFTPLTNGVAHVEFEFPSNTRFPVLPVRTQNGLIFPLKGVSDCAAPEIYLARKMGAKVKVRHGVIVPNLKGGDTAFGSFIKDCVQRRKSYPKNTLQNLFWKELSNSTYGKTAQGLREKRIFDLRDKTTKPLPPSKITNPFFAAFITSFVRAVLGEILNNLPEHVCVFSCTTDGFLSNATQQDIASVSQGELFKLFSKSREMLSGDDTVLEIKHQIRKPLGWRTRGQATLMEGLDLDETGNKKKENIVLAKGGIYTTQELDDNWLKNEYITDLFMRRTPESTIRMKVMTGVRDMVKYDADLVEKSLVKRLNMEFDWKRRPQSVKQASFPDHVAFSTRPWETVDQFMVMRQYWENFAIHTPFCMKTLNDYKQFGVYVLSQSSLGKNDSRYLKKKDPDIKRLRQLLGSAWKHSKAGFKYGQHQITNDEFAYILSEAGIECKRSDVENDGRKSFVIQRCPPTPAVYAALQKLSRQFPNLEFDAFISVGNDKIDLLNAVNAPCQFIERV
jgi:hypothetical protein